MNFSAKFVTKTLTISAQNIKSRIFIFLLLFSEGICETRKIYKSKVVLTLQDQIFKWLREQQTGILQSRVRIRTIAYRTHKPKIVKL